MTFWLKSASLLAAAMLLSGCLITSAVSTVVGTAVDVVDTVTPDITD